MKAMKSLVFFTSLPAVGGHTTSTLGLMKLLREDFRDIFIIAKEMPGHGSSPEALALLQEWGAHVQQIPSANSLLSSLSALQTCAFGGRLHRPTSFLAMGMRNLAPVLAFALHPHKSVYFHITHELSPAMSSMLNNYGRFFSQIVFISPATYRDFARQGAERRSVGLGVRPEPDGWPDSRPASQGAGPSAVGLYRAAQRGQGVKGSS